MEKEFEISNLSHLEIKFEWYDTGTPIIIEPRTGSIGPLDIAKFTVRFEPDQCRKYLLKPKLNYWSNPHKIEQLVVRCIGEGIEPRIESESSFVDFGSIMAAREKLEKVGN